MDCGTARKLVDDLLDGRLSIDREAELRAHAEACPECSAAIRAADAMTTEISASFQAALGAAPSDMPTRVMKAVALAREEDRPWRARLRRTAWIAGAAASLAAAVGIAYAVRRPAEDESRSSGSGGGPVAVQATVDRESIASRKETTGPAHSRGKTLVVLDDSSEKPAGGGAANEGRVTFVNENRGDGVAHAPAKGELGVPREPDDSRALARKDVGVFASGRLMVQVEEGAPVFEARPGSALHSGEVLHVTGDGPAEIALADRVALLLDVGAEVMIAPDLARPFDVRLRTGQLFAEVEKGTPFRVLTNQGVVQSIGTRFGVSLSGSDENAEIAVSVEEGVVRVQGDGESALVARGQSIRKQRGRGFRRDAALDCERRLRWARSFRAGHRRSRDPEAPDRKSGVGHGGPKGKNGHGDAKGTNGYGGAKGRNGGSDAKDEKSRGGGKGRRSRSR